MAIIMRQDIFLDDPVFLRLGFEEISDSFSSVGQRARLADYDRALEILKKDPDLGARFLGLTVGNGTIYWTGDFAGDALNGGGTVGARIINRRSGDEVVGTNQFGQFLEVVRHRYREYLKDAVVDEIEPQESQVIVDFTRKGNYFSDTEEKEREGIRFIHTDQYRPARFRFDSGRDGTTGHASRKTDDEASFQKFECPFGTSYPSPIIVESAAEASYLFERALRGELDWNALFDNLAERGLLNRNMNERQRSSLAQEYTAQFSWMREQICTDTSLKYRRIVASSFMVGDSSLGRSIYDYEHAPSPAHVLARYINNPVLLFTPAENSVVRSLSERNKHEIDEFRIAGGDAKTVDILVIGSDTIGGREPGRRATSTKVREVRKQEDGTSIITSSKQFSIPMKTKEAVEADYEAFSARMDELLAGIPEGVAVRFITGNSSSMGDSIGVGTPRMVQRYVTEHGGDVLQWNFYKGEASKKENTGARKGEVSDNVSRPVSTVLMEHFSDCVPVLTGNEKAVSFLVDSNDEESEVVFSSSSGLKADGAVCLSVKEDAYNRNVLSLGSYVLGSGIPVVHVQENRTLEEQSRSLQDGALLSSSGLSGEVLMESGLFDGPARRQWVLAESNMLSFIDSETQLAIPMVTNSYPVPVMVGNYPFKSPLGAYIALVAVETGHASRAELAEIAQNEGITGKLLASLEGILDGKELPARIQEKLLSQSVRLFAGSNTTFADRLIELDDKEIVMPVNISDKSGLFVNMDGEGLNRFGIVLGAERRMLIDVREARRRAEEEERQRSMEEAARRQKISVAAKAEGQKVAGGLPRSIKDLGGAVWFGGTHTPDQLALPDDGHSFDMWDDMDGDDPLVREKAARPYVDDGAGGRVKNEFVYLFPSDLAAVTGRRRVVNRADSRDLTGVTRKSEKTGEDFVCAYGIPVRMNNRGNEFDNHDNLPCSYRLDNDAANYAESLVLADSSARSVAIREGLALCLPGRSRRDGTPYYTLGQVFMEKSWNKKERKWDLNPHRSPLNENLTQRYISLLEKGQSYPLNFIPLPQSFYRSDEAPGLDQSSVDGEQNIGRHRISAEGRFVSDLMLSLRIANSTALALGVPLRFPLDEDGHIDLGPGVPEEFRALAERKIDSFIGVVKEEDIINGPLPYLERISMFDASRSRENMVKAGTDLYIAPNDLVFPFGQYDFSSILAGQPASLHEMAFRMEDGTVFLLTDAKSTRSTDMDDINKYLRYEKNDIRRFTVRTTNVEKVPEFIAAVKAYSERSKAVQVESRLVREGEAPVRNESMEGFVYLHSSNSDSFVEAEQSTTHQKYVVNIMGNEFVYVDSVYTALVASHYGLATPARIAKIAKIESSTTLSSTEKAAKLAELRATWSDEKKFQKEIQSLENSKTLSPEEKKKSIAEKRQERRAVEDSLLERAENLFVEVVREKSHEIGKEMSAFNLTNRFDNFDAEQVYWGKVDANDGFKGYAQIRYLLPDGTQSSWQTVKDLDLAKDIVMSTVNRVYRSDDYVVPSDQVMKMLLTAQAVDYAGEQFRTMDFESRKKVETDDKVVTLQSSEPEPEDVKVTSPAESPEMESSVNPSKSQGSDIVFTVSEGGYSKRTWENANADDVDFTIAFASNFNTAGERCTAKAAGDSLIAVELPLKQKGGLDLSPKAIKKAVDFIVESVGEDFIHGESMGLNIAGNGIYTLGARGVTQDQCDEFLVKVLDSLVKRGAVISSIRSGGQTGIDEAGVVAGKVLNIPSTVHAPKNWTLRGLDGKDVSGEAAYKERFAKKDYQKLSSGLKVRKSESLKQSV